MAIGGLNHAVLYVSDIHRSLEFYTETLGFERFDEDGPMVFLRGPASDKDHDIALFNAGPQAANRSRQRVGLFHLAIEVETLDHLAEIRGRLADLGSLSGEADHGSSKSVFAADPDGNLLEIIWPVPRHFWKEGDENPIVRPLNLEYERNRFAQVLQDDGAGGGG